MALETKLKAAMAAAGMDIPEVSERTEIAPDRLRECLDGRDEPNAYEYLALCKLLKLDPYKTYFGEEYA